MGKHNIKKAIFANWAVLILAVLMFVSATVAWFSSVHQSDTEHKIFIGQFNVDKLDSTDKFSDALNISMTDMYPMLAAKAYAEADGQNHHYRFQLTNTGTVHAMYRFHIAASGEGQDDQYKLSRQLKYSLRFNRNRNTLVNYTEDDWYTVYTDQYVFNDLLTGQEKTENISLQDALDRITVSPEIPADNSDPDFPIERVPEKFTANGELRSGSATLSNMYYEICFWLSERATLETAGNKTATLIIGAYFIQSVGGGNWDNWKTIFNISD